MEPNLTRAPFAGRAQAHTKERDAHRENSASDCMGFAAPCGLQVLTMLCASVLADLEATVPVEMRIAPPSGDAASVVDSEASAISAESSELSATASTVSSLSTTVTASDSEARVGAPRDFSGHADGTTNAYNSLAKWVFAALRKLGKESTDIVLPSMEPNDALCSQLHALIATWHTSRTTARNAGVNSHR